MIHYQFQHSWWVHKAILQLCVRACVHLVHKKDLLFPKSTRFYGKSRKDKWAAALSKRTPLSATRCSCCAIKFRTLPCLSHWIVDWKYQRALNKKKKKNFPFIYTRICALSTQPSFLFLLLLSVFPSIDSHCYCVFFFFFVVVVAVACFFRFVWLTQTLEQALRVVLFSFLWELSHAVIHLYLWTGIISVFFFFSFFFLRVYLLALLYLSALGTDFTICGDSWERSGAPANLVSCPHAERTVATGSGSAYLDL